MNTPSGSASKKDDASDGQSGEQVRLDTSIGTAMYSKRGQSSATSGNVTGTISTTEQTTTTSGQSVTGSSALSAASSASQVIPQNRGNNNVRTGRAGLWPRFLAWYRGLTPMRKSLFWLASLFVALLLGCIIGKLCTNYGSPVGSINNNTTTNDPERTPSSVTQCNGSSTTTVPYPFANTSKDEPYSAYTSDVLADLDETISPCDNFYKFVCNKRTTHYTCNCPVIPIKFKPFAYPRLHGYLDLYFTMKSLYDGRSPGDRMPKSVHLVVELYFRCIAVYDLDRSTRPATFPLLNEAQIHCLDKLSKDNSLVFLRLFADHLIYDYFEEKRNETKVSELKDILNKVTKLAQSVKKTFSSSLFSDSKTAWLKDHLVNDVKEKVDNIGLLIGFPEFIFDDELLDKIYGFVNGTPPRMPDIYDHRRFEIRAVKSMQIHGYPKGPNGPGSDGLKHQVPGLAEWDSIESLFTHYTFKNQLAVPLLDIMNNGFSLDYPAAVNYAILGYYVGHQLIHSIDVLGNRFSRFGAILPAKTWSDEFYKGYEQSLQCFVQQYQRFGVSFDLHTIEGPEPLDENLADNSGLKFAYLAAEDYSKEVGNLDSPIGRPQDETNRDSNQLSGLRGKFTSEQMFFVSFAHQFCISEEVTESMAKHFNHMKQEHVPTWYRVNVALCNFDRFREAFKCGEQDKMVCHQMCISSLW